MSLFQALECSIFSTPHLHLNREIQPRVQDDFDNFMIDYLKNTKNLLPRDVEVINIMEVD